MNERALLHMVVKVFARDRVSLSRFCMEGVCMAALKCYFGGFNIIRIIP